MQSSIHRWFFGLDVLLPVNALVRLPAVQPVVPRVWDDHAIATLEVPLANPAGASSKDPELRDRIPFTAARLRFCSAAVGLVVFVSSINTMQATTILSFTGNLRTDATFTSCGSGCTLGPTNSDGDYAQYAAVVRDFI